MRRVVIIEFAAAPYETARRRKRVQVRHLAPRRASEQPAMKGGRDLLRVISLVRHGPADSEFPLRFDGRNSRRQDTRCVHELDVSFETKPLKVFGHARAGFGLRSGPAQERVNDGGFAGVGNSNDHRACDTGRLLSPRAADCSGDLDDATLFSSVHRDARTPALRQALQPTFRRGRIGEIVTVEHDEARASAGKLVKQRITPAARDARIDDLDDDIDRAQVLAKSAHGLGHVTGVPLNRTLQLRIYSSLRFLESSQSAPNMLGGQTPATARPIKRASLTAPKERESSLLARLSPKT